MRKAAAIATLALAIWPIVFTVANVEAANPPLAHYHPVASHRSTASPRPLVGIESYESYRRHHLARAGEEAAAAVLLIALGWRNLQRRQASAA